MQEHSGANLIYNLHFKLAIIISCAETKCFFVPAKTAGLPYLIRDSSVKSMKVNQLVSGAPSELSIVFSSKVQVLSP